MTPLHLHPLQTSDTGDLLGLWSDFEVTKYTNWAPLSREDEVVQRLERVRTRYAGCEDRVGPLVIRLEDGAFVGLIGIDYVEQAHELWYLLSRAQWGRGYGGAAVEALLRQIAGRPLIRTLVATAVVGNVASWRLLERAGFTRVGVLPGAFRRNGLESDLYKYERRDG